MFDRKISGGLRFDINLEQGRSTITFKSSVPYPLRLPKKPKGLEGLRIVYQLRDDTGIHLTIGGKDKRGNAATIDPDAIEATSSDPAILTVTKDADGRIRVEPVGPIGTAQVQIEVAGTDIDPDAPGDQTVKGMFDVEVVGGAAVSLDISPSDTFPVS